MTVNRKITRIERATRGGGFLVRVMRKNKRMSAHFEDDAYGEEQACRLASRRRVVSAMES